mgnify:CR=1 FL=1
MTQDCRYEYIKIADDDDGCTRNIIGFDVTDIGFVFVVVAVVDAN